jgi:hypothetical protein
MLKSTCWYILVCTFWEKYILVHTSIYQNKYISVYTNTYRYIPVHGGSALVHSAVCSSTYLYIPVHGVSFLVLPSTQQYIMVHHCLCNDEVPSFKYIRVHSRTSPVHLFCFRLLLHPVGSLECSRIAAAEEHTNSNRNHLIQKPFKQCLWVWARQAPPGWSVSGGYCGEEGWCTRWKAQAWIGNWSASQGG